MERGAGEQLRVSCVATTAALLEINPVSDPKGKTETI